MLVKNRQDGYVPIAGYGVIGDGRSVALVAPDGALDWWCAPNLDSTPIFDRLLNAASETYVNIYPKNDYTTTQCYCKNSNVLCVRYATDSGELEVLYSLNSGTAGRLPWSELGVRCTVVRGSIEVAYDFRLSGDVWHESKRSDTSLTFTDETRMLTLLSTDKQLLVSQKETVNFTMSADKSLVLGIIVTDGQPQLIPSIKAVDDRIDLSDREWRDWSKLVTYDGPYRDAVIRSSLALKLLLYSPSGGIAAAGTTGLPERIGGDKNYDYRFAWVRDVAYTIKAFMRAGLTEEVQAALAWLVRTIAEHEDAVPHAFYTLMGGTCGKMKRLDVSGYRDSRPVHTGNQAFDQLQLSVFGDILETLHLFVDMGNQLDKRTIKIVVRLLDACQKSWTKKDSGIWELPQEQHYTMSKIGCWLAFDRAIKLCELGVLPKDKRKDWERTRSQIKSYIEEHCWSEAKQSYVQYVGSDKLDASLMLATRFGYPNKSRLAVTLKAITRDLQTGPLVYRYSGAEKEEGAFVACSYWLVEGYAFLGMHDKAAELMEQVLNVTRNDLGLMSEMVDPKNGEFLGNIPQGLSHLAMIHAADSINSAD